MESNATPQKANLRSKFILKNKNQLPFSHREPKGIDTYGSWAFLYWFLKYVLMEKINGLPLGVDYCKVQGATSWQDCLSIRTSAEVAGRASQLTCTKQPSAYLCYCRSFLLKKHKEEEQGKQTTTTPFGGQRPIQRICCKHSESWGRCNSFLKREGPVAFKFSYTVWFT